MHSFQASQIDATKCQVCKRNYFAHTKLAECEACDYKGEGCEIFGRPDDPQALLLCPLCYKKEQMANDVVIAHTQSSAAKTDNLLELSQQIDQSIRISEDLFNAETVAIAELKAVIDNDETLSESEKHEKLHNVVMERIQHYKAKIFQLDKEKHDLIVQQQVNIKFLRDRGAQLKAKIREELKLADSSYVPAVPIKIPAIKKPVQTPQERLIEMTALAKGISKTQAEILLKESGLIKEPEVVVKETPLQKIAKALAEAKGISIEEAEKRIKEGNVN